MLVWAYKHRSNSKKFVESEAQKINWGYKLTESLISMNTHKTKDAAAGTFEVHLAPTANWIARLTPGSWCCLLMTRDEKLDLPSFSTARADRRSLKFFGRISDVRVNISVDGNTGARQKIYVVTGTDWGTIFKSNLYIDAVAREDTKTPDGEEANAISTALKLLFDKQLFNWAKSGKNPTSTENVRALVNTWGKPVQTIEAAADDAAAKFGFEELQLNSGTFTFPKEVMRYLGLNDQEPAGPKPGDKSSVNVADNISWYTGILTGSDGRFKPEDSGDLGAIAPEYVYEDIDEAGSFPDPDSITGPHELWSLLVSNSNEIINEMFNDLRWDGDVPRLAVYKRVKPFVVNPDFLDTTGTSVTETIEDKISLFQNIRTFEIPFEDVTNINAGTNYDTLKNFVEILPGRSPLMQGVQGSPFKSASQISDRASLARSGFRPIIHASHFIPYTEDHKKIDVEAFSAWKWLVREWHFNTHNMLNGTLSIIGQNIHIGVGDNITMLAKVLGPEQNFNKYQKDDAADNPDSTFLTMHVESVMNNFSVDANGVRTFVTQIGFVRGIFTTANGQSLADLPFALDLTQDATFKDTKSTEVWSTKTEGDPG